MPFVHLHTHSHYSLLDGLSKIDELLDRAKELGMESIALTDHGNLYGAVEFTIKAKERGLKPIIGCEVYVAPHGMANKENSREGRTRNHLILLVKNKTGYHNLMKIVTTAYLEGFYYKPRVDHDVLEKHHEGLIALSGCPSGELGKALSSGNEQKAKEIALWYQNTFGKENYFFEMQSHPHFDAQNAINDGVKKLSRELDIPLVATADSHYIHKDDAASHDILLCIQTNRKVHEEERMKLIDFDLSLRSPEEMAEAFKDTPEAITNTEKIAAMCDFEIPMGEIQLPEFPLPEGKTADQLLRELTEEGLEKRFGKKITDEHRERMDYELEIITKTGYAAYTLIVADFVNWAKDNNIVVGPGRGSAAGSFVSYLLGITNIDPIEYNLLFERYLNPERVSMPDVDMDFADDRRDEVLAYVQNKYGHDHVAQIITFGTMAARASIRDVGRALGLPYDFCDQTAKLIPMFSTIAEALENVPEFAQLYNQDPSAQQLIDNAQRLEGVARHASVHACGVVITKKPVVEYTPLQHIVGNDEGIVTQYSSSTKSSFVEKIGLLKMDFLGLKNLTIIQNTLRIVGRTRNVDIDIDDMPLDDHKAYELLQSGHTTGIFQLESSGMRRYLKQLKPTVLEDLIAMVALYRPGPMEWIPDFIAGKHGQKKVDYLHPKLEPILQNTYGVAVYQEQVMQIAQELAGYSLGEADILRKAMGKKILKLIREQREKFTIGCIKNGIDKHIAEKVFDFIEPFAGYGFNRSHAACYALVGYHTAFLKAHYPAAFMAALMTADQGNTDRIAIEAHECAEMNIAVLPPDVNESFEEFAVIGSPDDPDGERIRFGLNAIKNVGHNVAREIVANRKKNGKFKDLSDFLTRIAARDMNKKSLEALAKVGALECFAERNQILSALETVLTFSKDIHRASSSNQGMLFGEADLSTPTITLPEAAKATKKQKLTWEKELLGLYVSDHPASEFTEYFTTTGVPLKSLTQDRVNQHIRIGGIVEAVKKIYTKKKNQPMLFVTIEDLTGATEVIVFPKLLEETPELWEEGRPVTMSGKLSDKNGEIKFLADSAKEINEQEIANAQQVASTKAKYDNQAPKNDTPKESETPETQEPPQTGKLLITLPTGATQDTIKKLSSFFDTCKPGGTVIHLEHGGMKLQTPYTITVDAAVKEKIREITSAA